MSISRPLVLLILSIALASCGDTTATATPATDVSSTVPVTTVLVEPENADIDTAEAEEDASDPDEADGTVEEPVETDIRSVDFMNGFTHEHSGFEQVVTATVQDGEAENGAWGDEDFYWFRVTDVSYGDLTGDGADEAVVSSGVSFGGSGFFANAVVYGMEDGETVELADLSFGDRATGGLHGTSIADGTLTAWVYDGTQGACCPNFLVKASYVLTGSELVPTSTSPRIAYLAPQPALEEELKFAPGSSEAVVAAWDSEAGTSFTFDARGDQTMTLQRVWGPQPITVTLTPDDGSAERDVTGLDTWLLEHDGFQTLTMQFDDVPLDLASNEALRQSSTFMVSIVGGETPQPATPSFEFESTTVEVAKDDVTITATTKLPVFAASTPGGTFATEATKAQVAASVNDWLAYAKEDALTERDSEFDLTSEVVHVSSDTISIRLSTYEYACCRAYSNLLQESVVVDVVSERVLEHRDIVDMDNLAALNTLIIEELERTDEFIAELNSEPSSDYPLFSSVLIVPGGIEFGTSRGAFGAAVGPLNAFVSAEALGDLLLIDVPPLG